MAMLLAAAAFVAAVEESDLDEGGEEITSTPTPTPTPKPAIEATPEPTPEPTPVADVTTMHSRAIRLFYNKKYAPAREIFAQIVREYPDAPQARDALFKFAESFYREGNWRQAGAHFRLYQQRYPLAPNASDAELRVAACESKYGEPIPVARPLHSATAERHQALIADRLPFADDAALRRGLATFSAGGFNTLIVQGNTRPGLEKHAMAASATVDTGVYFITPHAPVVFDIVDAVSPAIKSYDMRLMVRLAPLRQRWVSAQAPEWMDRRYDTRKGELVTAPRLDPFDADAVRLAQKVLEDLARTPVDGIVIAGLSFDKDEGFSEDALAAYERTLGLRVDPARLFSDNDDAAAVELGDANAEADRRRRVGQVRAQRLTELLRRWTVAIKTINSAVQVYVEIDPRAVLDVDAGRLESAQDAAAWFDTNIDGLLVACDWRDLAPNASPSDRPSVVGQVAQKALQIHDDPLGWFIALPTQDTRTMGTLPHEEIQQAVRAARSAGPVSLALFPTRLDFPYTHWLQPIPGSEGSKESTSP
ncbi:MAG: tetratricopeptide repeat protein [Deltaproteobacteria bacterium]|nr:tetratricopeptide repeat protein [Deltaproteobacteria bacterium]